MWRMARGRRQPKATKPRKDDVVRMRVPAIQKQALVEAAAREGLELSAWLRQLALRAAGVLPESEPPRWERQDGDTRAVARRAGR